MNDVFTKDGYTFVFASDVSTPPTRTISQRELQFLHKANANQKQVKGHGKGKSSRQIHANIDDPKKLSVDVRIFHETIGELNIDDGCAWNKEVFKHYRIFENLNARNGV